MSILRETYSGARKGTHHRTDLRPAIVCLGVAPTPMENHEVVASASRRSPSVAAPPVQYPFPSPCVRIEALPLVVWPPHMLHYCVQKDVNSCRTPPPLNDKIYYGYRRFCGACRGPTQLLRDSEVSPHRPVLSESFPQHTPHHPRDDGALQPCHLVHTARTKHSLPMTQLARYGGGAALYGGVPLLMEVIDCVYIPPLRNGLPPTDVAAVYCGGSAAKLLGVRG